MQTRTLASLLLTRLVICFGLCTAAVAHADPALKATTLPDGSITMENSQLKITLKNRVGAAHGIVGWFYKPTGFEMIDVLYGQTDYVEGHVCGERWDTVKDFKGRPSGAPATGGLLVPVGIGTTEDGSALIVTQKAEDQYRLTKTYILRRDLATLELRYELTNLTGEPKGFSLRLHTAFSPGARGKYHPRDDIVYLDTVDGVLELEQGLPQDEYHRKYEDDRFFYPRWSEEPARAWVWGKLKTPALRSDWAAQVRPANGDGMAFVIPGDELIGYYNCPGITLEPVMRAVSLLRGETWKATIFLGSFTGAKGRKVAAATPLLVVTRAFETRDRELTGEALPLFAGTLSVADPTGKSVIEAAAEPGKAVAIQADLPGAGWRLVARDRDGSRIGAVSPDLKASLAEPTIRFEPKKKPKVRGKVYLAKDATAGIEQFLEARDFIVQCTGTASEEEKAVARRIAGRLGTGLRWTNPEGKMLVIGTPGDSRTIAEAGLLKNSISADWPGEDRGAILHYDNFEGTSAPLLLVTGSSAEGVAKAGELFEKRFLAGVEPPKGFEFWPTGTEVKVYPYHRPYLKQGEKISLEMAKGEYEPAQFVITAHEDLHGLEVSVSPLVHTETKKEMDRRYITPFRRINGPLWLRWVNYYPVDPKNGWTGYPDPLLERAEVDLKAGQSQALWLTVIASETATPGLYTSAVTCKVGDEEKTIPLEVKVWDLLLPRTSILGEPYMHLDNLPPDNVRRLEQRHITALTRNFVEHGMRVMHLGNPDMFRWHFSKEAKYKSVDFEWLTVSDDGTIALDASLFDEVVDTMDKSAVPFELRYMVYVNAVTKGIAGFRRVLAGRHKDQPKRKGHWYQGYEAEELFRVLHKHLVRRGLLERVVVKIADEPRGFDWWWGDFTLAARNAKLPFMTCFNSIDWKQAEKGIGKVAVWQPLYMHQNAEFFKKAKAAGDLVSWYNCGPPPKINIGATASEIRGYLWQAARCELDIVAWWGIQCWHSWAQQWQSRYSHHNSVTYPRHPKKPAWMMKGKSWVDTEPIDGIRWELIREGIEDHKYVTLLRQEIAKAREAGRAEAADTAQAVLDRIWKEVFPTLNDYAPEYGRIFECRRRIAEAALSLREE